MFFKILLALVLLFQSNVVLVDKIAAIVNNEIITVTDIDKAILFFPLFQEKNETEQDFINRILQDLINYRVIVLEYKDDFTLIPDDFEAVQLAIIKKAGSLTELYRLFRRFHMNWIDFKNFIRDKVFYEKVLRDKFQLEIIIDFKEIETFYLEEYVVQQNRLKLPVKTLVEMTELIEKHLQKIKIEERLSGWLNEIRSSYRIENKLIKE